MSKGPTISRKHGVPVGGENVAKPKPKPKKRKKDEDAQDG